MIQNHTVEYSKTIGTLHHNCLLFFVIITIFYHMGPVVRSVLANQATKLISQINKIILSESYFMERVI